VVQAATNTININSDTGKAGVTVANTGSTAVNVTSNAGEINVENNSATVSVASGKTVETVATNNTNSGAVSGTVTNKVNTSETATLTLDHIEIATYPSKLTYAAGSGDSAAPDTSGMVVKAYYSVTGFTGLVSKSVDSSNYTVSNYVPKTAGTQTITVTYSEKTAAFPITVVEKKISLIALTALPTKTAYTGDSALDLTGGVLTVAYTNSALYPNVTVALSDSSVTVSGYQSGYNGSQTITVAYGGLKAYYTITNTVSTELASADAKPRQ
jgi:hypothetical protein